MTTGLASSTKSKKNSFLSFDLLGGNPTKLNPFSVQKPELVSAARTALGPGIASTVYPAASTSAVNFPPGSDTRGVPASLTTAIVSPRANF